MIFSYSRCYLCKIKTNFKNSLLCQNCFSRAQKLKWENCARCGTQNCDGCVHLSEFSNIYSLYTYGNLFSEILLLAKDKNDITAQILFFEMFFVSTRLYLIDIINKNCYSHIVLSPLRRERILNSAWHTNVFYEKVLLGIVEDFRLEVRCPDIFSAQIVTKSQKQAAIPSAKRKALNELSIESSIILKIIHQNKNNSFENKNILLVDDVLTSGNTLISLRKNINKIRENNNCDIFTLFRSPQSIEF